MDDIENNIVHTYINILDLVIKHFNLRRILEVGIDLGYTCIYLNDNNNLDYYCIDTWSGKKFEDSMKYGNNYNKFLDRLNEHNYNRIETEYSLFYLKDNNKRINILRKDSISASNDFPNNYFDLVFIDAEHTYNSVKMDINVWLPKIKSDGFISCHDYKSPNFPTVEKACNEYCLPIECEYIDEEMINYLSNNKIINIKDIHLYIGKKI